MIVLVWLGNAQHPVLGTAYQTDAYRQHHGASHQTVGHDGLDAYWTRLFEHIEKSTGAGGGFVGHDLMTHPARGAADGHKQATVTAIVCHFRQVFDVHVSVARLIDFERLTIRLGKLWFKVI